MTINVNKNTYNLIVKEANKYENGDIEKYLEELMREVVEIVPTREEKRVWKENLYNACRFLATERPEFEPSKKDSLENLKDSYLYWAKKYNDGYFPERDEADTDRFCEWLVQQYDWYR